MNRILGILVRQHDRACDRVRATLVQSHERGKRLGVTALGGDDERMLTLSRRWFRRRKHCGTGEYERSGDRHLDPRSGRLLNAPQG